LPSINLAASSITTTTCFCSPQLHSLILAVTSFSKYTSPPLKSATSKTSFSKSSHNHFFWPHLSCQSSTTISPHSKKNFIKAVAPV